MAETDDRASLTPAERRRLRVRETILDAAEKVFALEGAEGLSIRRLADEIDYSPAAIYKYFASKEELIDELKEAFFARILEQVDEVVAGDRPFLERARACLVTYVLTALEKTNHYAAAFSGLAEGAAAPRDWSEFSQTNKGQAFMYLVDMVCEGQQEGVFRPRLDPVLAAKSAWASCHGLAMLLAHMPKFPEMMSGNAALNSREFIEFHADQVIRGLQGGLSADLENAGVSGTEAPQ